LETNGRISSVELNFTGHTLKLGNAARDIQDSPNRHTIPDRIKATMYESVTTSGYFFTVTIPGVGVLPAERDYAVNREYYIVYYGIETEANLTSQIPFLEDMIAETYRYDHMPSVGALI
jgi:hypothetical protein